MKALNILLSFLIISTYSMAQKALTYQKPPKEILELVDIDRPPFVDIDEKGQYLLLKYVNSYKSIAELSETEMRLAGLRINPVTNISSRVNYFRNFKIKTLTDGQTRQVEGLPEDPRFANLVWSPDQSKLAFTHTAKNGVELWVLDMATAQAKRLTEAKVNANLSWEAAWFKDGKSLLVKIVPPDRKALISNENAVPTGPTISEGKGEKAQNRTYQDLLQNRNDEFNFEQLALSELYRVDLNGNLQKWADAKMYEEIEISPDGNYVMVSYIEKPFSYLVPYYRFPSKTVIFNADGTKLKDFNKAPLTEELPKGFMAVKTGKRNIQWRSDKPATLVWYEALDGGDPEQEAAYRDEVFMQAAPFENAPISIFKTQNRCFRIFWGSDEFALVYDYWWNTRSQKTYIIQPGNPQAKGSILFDRNYQDQYSNPGNPLTTRNEYGESVLLINDNHFYTEGPGHSPEGQFPFLDQYDAETGKKERIYESKYTDKLEEIIDVVDIEKDKLLVRIESATEYPNYYFRTIGRKDKLEQITYFKNPFEKLQSVHKEVVKYKRKDGLELSGTLYLPLDYDMQNKERVPLIMWAYPREYKDRSSAGQSTANPNEFTYPYYGSMIYWVTRGYAVLDDAAFPIVGVDEEEPNDSFVEQLTSNAKAAIDYLDSLGYIDPARVAVGGHSYGAFMTANLLTHTNLFAAGIARSGAYNRTLTPFGFQSEERSYWEAPEVYYTMSPFMHADEMKTPLLLIHGEADNNSGTYPMQSERYFNALKGLGATVRLVILPKESHGYRAKESILHLLWEQDQWLEKYVKNK